MKDVEVIRAALDAAGNHRDIVEWCDLSGGCIHRVKKICLADGTRLVAKLNRASQIKLFEEEAEGLRALAATHTVLVPQPIVVIECEGNAILLMTAVPTRNSAADSAAWRRLGEELAALHHADVGQRYGFTIDNHIGSTPQPNAWHNDWVEFNRDNRLGFQLNLAVKNHLLRDDEARPVQIVIDRLDQWIPHQPKPALLHGDLWSGNALPTEDGRIAVIDPACSIGDGWADIAMMQLFGGFPQECFEAYAANAHDREADERRIAVYQLYHVLNHLNLFGRGYAGQAVELAQRLLAR